MDEIVRPASAMRYHGEASSRDKDTDSEEAMVDVGSTDEDDDPKPAVRKWSTGIRHSARLDGTSQKPVDYNMKRHPQDAQLRLLNNAVVPRKRSAPANSNDTDNGRDESNEEGSEGNEESAGNLEAPVPNKRTAYKIQHSTKRRFIFIHDCEDSSTDDDDDGPENYKENMPPPARRADPETDDEDEEAPGETEKKLITRKLVEEVVVEIEKDVARPQSPLDPAAIHHDNNEMAIEPRAGSLPPLSPSAALPTNFSSNMDDNILDDLLGVLENELVGTQPEKTATLADTGSQQLSFSEGRLAGLFSSNASANDTALETANVMRYVLSFSRMMSTNSSKGPTD